MSEETLFEFGPDWGVIGIAIERKIPERTLSFSVRFEKGGQIVELEFTGPNDTDSLPELIDVDRVIVSKEVSSQREFGTVKVEFHGEDWQEVWCDHVREVGQV
ncbi:hypothetical protein [Microbulbifer litoralis]|uniref:hypothetical protein n=1 Tax=Microbulbifer litoralis TaxID=2933965 RepID=UPI0020290272|nr:hypothetical protein [Microbulbifer sp. GX H0434]